MPLAMLWSAQQGFLSWERDVPGFVWTCILCLINLLHNWCNLASICLKTMTYVFGGSSLSSRKGYLIIVHLRSVFDFIVFAMPEIRGKHIISRLEGLTKRGAKHKESRTNKKNEIKSKGWSSNLLSPQCTWRQFKQKQSNPDNSNSRG